MAIRVFNGSTFDSVIGTHVVNTANTSLTTSYQAGIARTAPGIGVSITGMVAFLPSTPTLGDIEIVNDEVVVIPQEEVE